MTDPRRTALNFLTDIMTQDSAGLDAFSASGIAENCVFNVCAPIERLEGRQAILEGFYQPLRTGLSHARRRDEMFFGANNRRAEGGYWVGAVTHYVGNFTGPLFGIQPTGHLIFLRSGEFYRIDDGKITKGYIILDLLDLMRQIGRFPLPRKLGTEMLFPGPETHDGVCPTGSDGEANLDLVEAMFVDLHDYDPKTNSSKGQTGPTGYWHDDMLWYGPGGIGSNYRWEGFVKDHRQSFLHAFPDREGGDHYCRIGDGSYVGASGWPSMTMTHMGEYLGIPATGNALTLRVMDFYRCAGGQIMENWVHLDYVDLCMQMGVDVIARSRDMDPTF